MTEFSKRLRTLLNKKGVSAAQLSRMTGIPESTLSRYLSGQFSAKQSAIFKISQALSVSPDYLLGTDDEIDQGVVALFNSLSEEHKLDAIDYMKYLKSKEVPDVQG